MSEPFVHSLRVRYADTDAQGVVFFANYLTYFDEAMMDYIAWLGIPWERLEADWGVDMVYVDAQCSYFQPCRFPETLQIRGGVGRVGTTSVTLQFAIHGEDNERRAQGQLTCVCVSMGSHEKAALPAKLKDALSRGVALF
jgi:acyl-CoA thioester hydrolase